MQETISGARAFAGGRFDPSTIPTDEGSAVSFSAAAEVPSTPFPCAKPGFADVYAHLRQPGFSFQSATEANTMQNLIAKDLLSIGAVFLRPDQPFTWASGIKSPIYCDNRLTLTAPAVRNDVENGLAEVIRREYPGVQVLMGTSTAGIAHAAIVGHLMNLPMGYVRSGAKDHGRGNRIEGKLEPGQKVVVVEDLISTAGSCIEVVEALREAGAEVLGVASIFTYGMQKGLDRLAAANVKNVSLTNLDAVAKVAAETGYIQPSDVERLLKFRDNPSDERWIGGGA